MLLDQSIIAGLGNITLMSLFLSNINPLTKSKDINDEQLQLIIDSQLYLIKAIKLGEQLFIVLVVRE